MRVLTVHPGPGFSVADVFTGWTRALHQAGAHTFAINMDERLELYERASLEQPDGSYRKAFDTPQAIALAAKGIEAACYELQPDVVLVVSGFFVPPAVLELMRVRGSKVVLLCTEQPYELDRELKLAHLVDVVLLNDPTHIDQFRAVNRNTFYQPHCYDPAVHFPGPGDGDFKWDFAFVGTGFESRERFLSRVDWSGLDVALAGNWAELEDGSPLAPFVLHDPRECIPNAEAADVYRAARMSANLYRKEAMRPELAAGWAMGPREVELAACQVFFAREKRGEGDRVLNMLPTFDTPEELGDLIRYYRDHDVLRGKLAGLAREAVADRTFVESAKRLLRLLERQ